MRPSPFTAALTLSCAALAGLGAPAPARAQDEEEIGELPHLVTPRTAESIERGIKYLASQQRRDGSFREGGQYGTYPVTMTALSGMAFLCHGDTPSRGRYAEKVARIVHWLTDPRQAGRNGLIVGQGEESRSMYGHGFASMFLACCLGEELEPELELKIRRVLKAAIELTGRAQSGRGGWLYTPDSGGDEGSVTVTQVQALRACRNAGLAVPLDVVKKAVRYIEASAQPDGGIAYQAGMTNSQPPISAAATAVLYNAGEYDSPVARRCLDYCRRNIGVGGQAVGRGFGHWFYTHLYLAQAYWQVGGKDWDSYYPAIRDHLLRTQSADGSWQGDGVGLVYGTAIAVTILSLPYERVPLYMR